VRAGRFSLHIAQGRGGDHWYSAVGLLDDIDLAGEQADPTATSINLFVGGREHDL